MDRLLLDGWVGEGGTRHETFAHADRPGTKIMVPGHRAPSPGVARNIARSRMDLRDTRSRHTVLIDGEGGAYGVAVPDCPGCTAMGETIDEAMTNTATALAEWMSDRIAAGFAPPVPRAPDVLRADPALADDLAHAVLGIVPVLVDSGRPVSIDLSLDAAMLADIDAAARLRGLTRSAFLVSAARDKIAAEG